MDDAAAVCVAQSFGNLADEPHRILWVEFVFTIETRPQRLAGTSGIM
jgi:hypothetical protein